MLPSTISDVDWFLCVLSPSVSDEVTLHENAKINGQFSERSFEFWEKKLLAACSGFLKKWKLEADQKSV